MPLPSISASFLVLSVVILEQSIRAAVMRAPTENQRHLQVLMAQSLTGYDGLVFGSVSATPPSSLHLFI